MHPKTNDHKYRVGEKSIPSDLEVLVNNKLNTSHQCDVTAKQGIACAWGCTNISMVYKSKEAVVSLPLCVERPIRNAVYTAGHHIGREKPT